MSRCTRTRWALRPRAGPPGPSQRRHTDGTGTAPKMPPRVLGAWTSATRPRGGWMVDSAPLLWFLPSDITWRGNGCTGHRPAAGDGISQEGTGCAFVSQAHGNRRRVLRVWGSGGTVWSRVPGFAEGRGSRWQRHAPMGGARDSRWWRDAVSELSMLLRGGAGALRQRPTAVGICGGSWGTRPQGGPAQTGRFPVSRVRPSDGWEASSRVGLCLNPHPQFALSIGAWDPQSSHACPLRASKDCAASPGGGEPRERLARRSYREGPQVGGGGAFWP
ncbi:hypothetical protein NN561_003355 [Cricetulus griseus]